jgi:FkbM family methyltransferase
MAGKEFFFVQVGACDGVSFDALHEFVNKYHLSGIAIEPLPDLYAQLCRNYEREWQVRPIKVALHYSKRRAEIYRVPLTAAGVPAWAKGIASFNPDHHKRSGIDSSNIVVETVPCVTWDELVQQNGITRIDYLQIDTEGYDSEILGMIDFNVVKPAIIRFEHQISAGVMTPSDLGNTIGRLVAHGYQILLLRYDAVAYGDWTFAERLPTVS